MVGDEICGAVVSIRPNVSIMCMYWSSLPSVHNYTHCLELWPVCLFVPIFHSGH